MSFQFKYKNKIINYLETELGLNTYKINKIIKDIEKIENNNTTNNTMECSICKVECRLIECSYCEEKICAFCYNLCKECNKKLCQNCFSKYCPICYDLCNICNNYDENGLTKRSIRGGDDSTYYFNICSVCNNLENIRDLLGIKAAELIYENK
jgi:hypothetical protein